MENKYQYIPLKRIWAARRGLAEPISPVSLSLNRLEVGSPSSYQILCWCIQTTLHALLHSYSYKEYIARCPDSQRLNWEGAVGGCVYLYVFIDGEN